MTSQNDERFPTFQKFMESLSSANLEDFASKPSVKVSNGDAFLEMKQHVQSLYDGVEVTHSFVDENGQIFDCIPIQQQPSLKGTSTSPAEPPDLPLAESTGGRSQREELSIHHQLRPDRVDKFGHVMQCPPGTIAMRRITLEELSRFGNLNDFFQKTPVGEGRHPRLSAQQIPPGGPQIASGVHKWAHAYQIVDNLGGHSFLNVWDPTVGSQIFSLSQHWYAGGSPVQTAECGWQVYPQKYGTTQPVLFIYWTADGYSKTGCYNLDCKAFVQTNHNWALGGTLAPVSAFGGPQYELEMAYYLHAGNWWLYLKGTSASSAVGYYPASQYNGGTLATHATDIDYGGEVVDITAWPPMGSGAYANAGWREAAYQRNIYYFPTGGGGVNATLTPSQVSANCFTVRVQSYAAPWSETIYFGGPGGTNCT